MPALPEALIRTDLPLPNRREGKVRDVYDLPEGPLGTPALLIVATDRISAFDVVLPTPIPGKGRLLATLSHAWLRRIDRLGLTPTHLLADDADTLDALSAADREAIRGRCTIGRRCEVVPVECVVRGYLDGSGWREYERTGEVCGVALPAGLRRGDELPEPIFTPATKAALGEHDENIPFDEAAKIAGADVMAGLRERSLAIYRDASAYARERGIILADTKFEFGWPVDARGERTGEEPILVDEALTPDSSRFWPADRWSPGGAQESFDKQFVREHLQSLVDRGAWDKRAPGPELPEAVVSGTLARYRDALERLFPGEAHAGS